MPNHYICPHALLDQLSGHMAYVIRPWINTNPHAVGYAVHLCIWSYVMLVGPWAEAKPGPFLPTIETIFNFKYNSYHMFNKYYWAPGWLAGPASP
jgi:hypothetical protein